jgi:hypothetical protein
MAMNNSVIIDSSTVDLKKTTKHTSAYFDSMEESNNKYRWYLCKESTPARWGCEYTSAHQALLPYTLTPTIKNTAAIPIYKFIPQSFDNVILTRNIRSMTHVKIVPPTAAAAKHD